MLEWLINAFDIVFSPLAVFPAHISLFIVSVILTVIVIILNKLSVNRNLVKEIKTKMEEIKENLTRAQKEGNKDEINRFLAEMMKLNGQYMRQTFKALIVSLIVISLFLPWIRYKYSGLVVGSLPFALPFIGSNVTWVWWYILVSFAAGWVIRKLIEGE